MGNTETKRKFLRELSEKVLSDERFILLTQRQEVCETTRRTLYTCIITVRTCTRYCARACGGNPVRGNDN